jgi:hypothetical protein
MIPHLNKMSRNCYVVSSNDQVKCEEFSVQMFYSIKDKVKSEESVQMLYSSND